MEADDALLIERDCDVVTMARTDVAHPGLVTRKCRKLVQVHLLQHKMPGGIPDSSVAEIVR